MMSSKDGVGQVIKACVTVATLIALPCWFRVIKAALDDLLGLTRWTRDAIWPTRLTDRLITLNLIDQILDVDLHRWTPVRGWNMGGHQYTTSSYSTTLKSNKSESRSAQGAGPFHYNLGQALLIDDLVMLTQ